MLSKTFLKSGFGSDRAVSQEPSSDPKFKNILFTSDLNRLNFFYILCFTCLWCCRLESTRRTDVDVVYQGLHINWLPTRSKHLRTLKDMSHMRLKGHILITYVSNLLPGRESNFLFTLDEIYGVGLTWLPGDCGMMWMSEQS